MREPRPHADLGSTVALTDAGGSVTHRDRYDAYGAPNASASTSTSSFRFLFTCREWLGLAGLQDNRNRVYSATMGRWLQVDPINFRAQDKNLYRYIGNQVASASDPEGLLLFDMMVEFIDSYVCGSLSAENCPICCGVTAFGRTTLDTIAIAAATSACIGVSAGTGIRFCVAAAVGISALDATLGAHQINSCVSGCPAACARK